MFDSFMIGGCFLKDLFVSSVLLDFWKNVYVSARKKLTCAPLLPILVQSRVARWQPGRARRRTAAKAREARGTRGERRKCRFLSHLQLVRPVVLAVPVATRRRLLSLSRCRRRRALRRHSNLVVEYSHVMGEEEEGKGEEPHTKRKRNVYRMIGISRVIFI